MVLVRPDEGNNIVGCDNVQSAVKVKAPKRILHFSDGVLEEYSSDEDEIDTPKEKAVVDPTTLTWGPWFWYKAWSTGSSTLSVMDKAGEFLAALFGITTPRYYFELEEYKKRNQEKQKEDEEMKGWSKPSAMVPLNEMPELNQPAAPVIDV